MDKRFRSTYIQVRCKLIVRDSLYQPNRSLRRRIALALQFATAACSAPPACPGHSVHNIGVGKRFSVQQLTHDLAASAVNDNTVGDEGLLHSAYSDGMRDLTEDVSDDLFDPWTDCESPDAPSRYDKPPHPATCSV